MTFATVGSVAGSTYSVWYGSNGGWNGGRLRRAAGAALFSSSAMPDFGGMMSALGTIGNSPSSSGGGAAAGSAAAVGRRRRRVGRRVLRSAASADRRERLDEPLHVVEIVVERHRQPDDPDRALRRPRPREPASRRSGPRSGTGRGGAVWSGSASSGDDWRRVDRPAQRPGGGHRQRDHRAEHRRRARGRPPVRRRPRARPPAGASLDRKSVVRAMTAGQPPSTSPPTNSSAAGTASQAVGSSVPCQSNSRPESRVGRLRPAFAPCEIVLGRIPAWRSRRTWRNAAPFGAQTHLWRLPV